MSDLGEDKRLTFHLSSSTALNAELFAFIFNQKCWNAILQWEKSEDTVLFINFMVLEIYFPEVNAVSRDKIAQEINFKMLIQ
jgi:hypothetical protein